MKKILITLLCIVIYLIPDIEIQAQDTEGTYDTLHIFGKGNKQKFTVTGTKFAEISLSGYEPRLANHKMSSLGRDIGRRSLTFFTGIGIGGTRDVDFVYPGQITANNEIYDWQTDIYCSGSVEKENKLGTK